MPQNPSDDLTQMLIQLSEGKAQMVDDILPLIYKELRLLAGNYLRRERSDHTLQPTALVHEAYIKLIDQTQVKWQNRAHFFGIAANIMRRILVDYARQHKADKRGGAAEKMSLEEEILIVSEGKSAELLALDEALENLAKLDPQKSKSSTSLLRRSVGRGNGGSFGRVGNHGQTTLANGESVALRADVERKINAPALQKIRRKLFCFDRHFPRFTTAFPPHPPIRRCA
jgi:RNA polymerase sigma factor (TIGR02999 family)